MTEGELAHALRLIVITDATLAGPGGVIEVVTSALNAGARCVQLRNKGDSVPKLMALGKHLRALTSELGCLSVSRICGIPNAAEAFDEDGIPADPARWEKIFGGLLNQLEWMAIAMKNHRAAVGVPK